MEALWQAINGPELIAGLLTAIVGALGAWALALVQSKIKSQTMRDLLAAAIRNSVGRIQQATAEDIGRAEVAHPTVDPKLAVGVQYVVEHAPEAITYFWGVLPPVNDPDMPEVPFHQAVAGQVVAEKIADKIIAQVGLTEIATNIAVAQSAGPIVVRPLDPVPAWKPVGMEPA